MTDEIKSNITNAFLVLVQEYGDPSSLNRKELEQKAECNVDKLFHRQRTADWAKKKLGEKSFNHAVALYLDKFVLKSGIDAQSLKKELEQFDKVLKYHLGKDKVRYLNLLSKISVLLTKNEKGLLAS